MQLHFLTNPKKCNYYQSDEISKDRLEIGKIWGFNIILINNTQEVGYPEELDIRGPPVLRYDFKKESRVPVFYTLSIKQKLFTLITV